MPEDALATPRGVRVQSVERAVSLLRALAHGHGTELTVTALATHCGLNRATAWRLLSTLEALDMVRCDRSTGQWFIGRGLIELAGSEDIDGLVRSAHSTLVRLSLHSGETAAFGLLRSGSLIYVDEVAPRAVVAATWRGRAVPLHATSSGKAVLAFLPPEDVAAVMAGGLSRYTTTTITDRNALHAELERVRNQGYAECRGEFEDAAYGVSSPVLDMAGRPMAVLSLWGPGDRLTEDRFPALGEQVAAAATHLSRRA